MLVLNFTNRNKRENKEGMLKAVFYGAKQESVAIFVDKIAFEKVYREAGQTSVISLEGEGKKYQVIVKDISYDPVKYLPNHVDFYTVEKGVKIDALIPLVFIGVSEGVKTLGGNLVKVMHELPVEAEASKLPREIEVDISVLDSLDSVIKAGDIKLPSGVSLFRTEEDEIVASIIEAKEEEESEAADIDSIEVEAKGKKEE